MSTQPQIDHFEALFKAIIINNFKLAAKLESLTDCEIELLTYYINGLATKIDYGKNQYYYKISITTRTVRQLEYKRKIVAVAERINSK